MKKKQILSVILLFLGAFLGRVNAQVQDTLTVISADTISSFPLGVLPDSIAKPGTVKTDTLKISLDSLYQVRFTAKDSSGCTPLTVSFATLFKDSLASYFWEFGDGETSILQNPKHTYLKPGIYSVKQKITIRKDSLVGIKEDFIHAYASVLPNFSLNQNCICTLPAKVTVFNLSKAAEKYQWIFPGGSPSEYDGFAPPEILYENPGNYPVTLITNNGINCTDTLTRNDYVKVGGKVAFGTPNVASNCPPFPVIFKDSTQGCIAGWEWDFGDGSKHSKVKDPVHIYDKAGDYDVKLTVTFKEGCKDSLVKQSFIKVGGPAMNTTFSQSEICQNQEIEFKLKAKGYIIFEPEKGVLKMIGNAGDSAETHIKYIYKNPGKHLPAFTVMDSTGCIARVPFKDTIIVNPSARLTFTAEPAFGMNPLKTTISPKLNPEDSVNSFIWLIEDKGQVMMASAEKNPEMLIDKSGRWDVRCITENVWGCRDTFFKKEFLAVYEQNISPGDEREPMVTFTNHPDGGINIQLITKGKDEFLINLLDSEGNTVLKDLIETEGGTRIYTLSTLTLLPGFYAIQLKSNTTTWKKEVTFEKTP